MEFVPVCQDPNADPNLERDTGIDHAEVFCVMAQVGPGIVQKIASPKE